MGYLVNLEKFYGPLDLLLYLLERDEIDIYDIPVASIADQYIEYINTVENINLDNVGDFLSMASYLLNLKSRLLLSGGAETNEVKSEGEDPRDELVQRILAYKQYKQIGKYLADRYDDEVERVYFRMGQVDGEEMNSSVRSSLTALVRAWARVVDRDTETLDYSLPQTIDIGAKMRDIMEILPEKGPAVIFQDIYGKDCDRSERLAYFVALLELVRLQKVEAYQEQRFGDINIMRVAVESVDAH